uniref:large ribosomal subunit protein mL53 n=1 Tax=Myxine glutinosa TaxID=7769 RepID=UPI00358F61CB
MAAPKALINLKAVKEIAVQFCPFLRNVRATREFLARVNVERVRKTNYACVLRTDVRHDGSAPCVTVSFNDDEKLVMKSERLLCEEMLSAVQKLCQQKEPPSDTKK